jgi:IS30 family transposase
VRLTNPVYPIERIVSKLREGIILAGRVERQPHADLVHTLTSDNGKEFAYHQAVAKGLDAQGYFAHPCHSWERGLNENTNGFIRQYLTKGTDFHSLTHMQVCNIMDKPNNRPRKCLGFKIPNQLFSGINPPVALTS